MAKNLLKRSVLEPRNLDQDQMFLKHGHTMKSEFVKYAIHFENSSCSFYVYRDQFPAYVIGKISTNSNLFHKGGGEPDSEYRISAPSVLELHEKIKDVFRFYLREYSKVKREKKILVTVNNNLNNGSLCISVSYEIFVEKTYYDAKGEVSDVKNVTDSVDEREFKLNNGDVFNYSKELEALIADTQKRLHENMSTLVSNIFNYKFLEQIGPAIEEDLDIKLIEN